MSERRLTVAFMGVAALYAAIYLAIVLASRFVDPWWTVLPYIEIGLLVVQAVLLLAIDRTSRKGAQQKP